MLTVTTKTSLNAKGIIFAIRVGLEITSVRHRPIPDVGCGGRTGASLESLRGQRGIEHLHADGLSVRYYLLFRV